MSKQFTIQRIIQKMYSISQILIKTSKLSKLMERFKKIKNWKSNEQDMNFPRDKKYISTNFALQIIFSEFNILSVKVIFENSKRKRDLIMQLFELVANQWICW